MSEEGKQQPAQDPGTDPAHTRLAVYEGPSDEKRHLATITISKTADGKWTPQADEADALLSEFGNTFSPTDRADLKMAVAIGSDK